MKKLIVASLAAAALAGCTQTDTGETTVCVHPASAAAASEATISFFMDLKRPE